MATDGIDLERPRRRDAVGELQPTHDVDEHQIEADRVEDRQRSQPQQQWAVVAQRVAKRRALGLLVDGVLVDAAPQREAREADQKADQEGVARTVP
jgi:hypothetical protein